MPCDGRVLTYIEYPAVIYPTVRAYHITFTICMVVRYILSPETFSDFSRCERERDRGLGLITDASHCSAVTSVPSPTLQTARRNPAHVNIPNISPFPLTNHRGRWQ